MAFSAILWRMPDFHAAERAIDSFEKIHGLSVTVHDLAGNLTPFLPPERFQHQHPICLAVKLHHVKSCVSFGVDQLRRDIALHANGRVQVCFAGLVEFVFPVFRKHSLMWVFFAGIRLPAAHLPSAVRDTTPPPSKPPWKPGTKLPKPVAEEEAQTILEALRQLAARLTVWMQEMESSGAHAGRPNPDFQEDDLASRRTLIQQFIHLRHTRPVRLADLAKTLHLSESRAGHVVRQVAGTTFVRLLTQARLSTAAELLRHTDLPVTEISVRSGFSELSHFHRYFKKRFGFTPRRYRMQAEVANRASKC